MEQIKTWLVRGDTHGVFTWMYGETLEEYKPEETAIIILGDCGFDFYLNKSDLKKKREVNARGYRIYWLRGNHEARPSDIEGYVKIFDEDVHGPVYCNPEFPNLRAFMDCGFYDIAGYTCLILGGAYSVDKSWRLQRACLTEKTNDPKRTGWFSNELPTPEERNSYTRQIKQFAATGKIVDFIMSHTCPIEYEPTDMFLNFIDQSTVDKSMENWLSEVRRTVSWNIWLFGHFHADRLERPHVEQYYNDIEELSAIIQRWDRYDETGELDWWLEKSPLFYEEEVE